MIRCFFCQEARPTEDVKYTFSSHAFMARWKSSRFVKRVLIEMLCSIWLDSKRLNDGQRGITAARSCDPCDKAVLRTRNWSIAYFDVMTTWNKRFLAHLRTWPRKSKTVSTVSKNITKKQLFLNTSQLCEELVIFRTPFTVPPSACFPAETGRLSLVPVRPDYQQHHCPCELNWLVPRVYPCRYSLQMCACAPAFT